MENILRKKEIHVFHRCGQVLAYDVEEMHLFEINSLTKAIFEHAEGKTPVQLAKALSDHFSRDDVSNVLDQLVKLNLLRIFRPEAEKNAIAENDRRRSGEEKQEKKQEMGIKRLVLFVTQDCNLKCRYCFTRSSGNIKTKSMSEDIARAAVDLLFEESNNTDKLIIGFYGGEPMLKFDLIKKIIPYSNRKAEKFHKTVTYTMTTNGTLLTADSIDWLVENKVQITMSIDGDKEIHNRNRIFPNGTGSYEKVFASLTGFIKKGGDIGTITVVSDLNVELKEIAQSLINMGITAVNFAPAISNNGKLDITLPEHMFNHDMDYIDIYSGQYEELVQSFLDNGLLFSETPPLDFGRIFRSLDKREKRVTNCGAAYSRLAIDADGNILPCDNFIGVPSFYMGHVLTGFDSKYQGIFKKIRASGSEICQKCWARHLCGGWCPFFSYNTDGDLKKPVKDQCRINKNHFEIAMGVYSQFKKKRKMMSRQRGEEGRNVGKS
jgi:uncharacterized protein